MSSISAQLTSPVACTPGFALATDGHLARAHKAFDALCALCLVLLTFAFVNTGRMPRGLQEFLAVRLTVRNVAFGLLLLGIWYASFALCGLYRDEYQSRESVRAQALRIVGACTLASCVISLFTFASRSGAFGPRVVVYFWAVATFVELVGRGAMLAAIEYVETSRRHVRHVVIVGSGPRALRLLHATKTRLIRNTEFVGFVDTVVDRIVPEEIESRLVSSLEGFEELLSKRVIDEVLIALPVKSCYAAIQETIDICERVGVEVAYFPDFFSVSLARRAYSRHADMAAVRLQLVPNDYRLIIKRAIDLGGATTGLIVFLPVLLLCALAVKLTSPGPILFSQVRYGHNRRLFRMYKFRTMVQDAEAQQTALESQNEARGPIFKIRADPRVTRVGRVLRKLSLDELPQLVNVLRGDMSLVGPRPMSMRDVSRFEESWLLRRFSVKPGLTCLWQVNGRSNTGFDRWVELDLAYIDNWSLRLDMSILIKTVPAVISGTGAM